MNKKLLIIIPVILFSVSIFLLISGNRVLLSETKVEPGQNYVLSEWGNLGEAEQTSLVCKYFTGRSVKISVYWYSPNNILGKDQCPFIIDEQSREQ
jgi:hypothetical protein